MQYTHICSSEMKFEYNLICVYIIDIYVDKSIDKRQQGEIKKKILLAAFYQLTYQHDSKDFNICMQLYIYIPKFNSYPPAMI